MSRYVHIGASATSPASNTQRKQIAVKAYIDAKGYVQNAAFVFRQIPALEHGPLPDIRAIVLHRTDSSTSASAFRAFERGIGTHFVVDKDGTVYQTASLNHKTWHVGKIRSRCEADGSCEPSEAAALRKMSFSQKHGYEKSKPYPQRYPMNEDSVGIETVADYDPQTSTWDAATAAQAESIRALVYLLKREYGLSESDIYEHDRISYKTAGEGADLYDLPAPALLPPGRPGP